MPSLDGYALACAALEFRPKLKVIMMTGYTQSPMPNQLRHAHIPVIMKPFDYDQLVVDIDRIFDR